jgi:uncharacterized membrane protein
MAFCGSCGAQVADGTAFCPKCGKPVAAAHGQSAPPPASQGSSASATAGMEENVASTLCYSLGWITGIVFLLIDKRHTVRFHAAQSIVVFGITSILYWIIVSVFGLEIAVGRAFGGMPTGLLLYYAICLVMLAAWIFLMYKAYNKQMFRVPGAADIADSIAGKVQS